MNDYDVMMGLIDPEVLLVGMVIMLGVALLVAAVSKGKK